MYLKSIYFKALSNRDRKHVKGKLNIGPSPFMNNTAVILGGGSISDKGLRILETQGVDLALNSSKNDSLLIKNIMFEIPNLTDDKQFIFTYYDYLKKMHINGTKLYYRPSARDSQNELFNKFKNIIDYYVYEQRVTEDNHAIFKQFKHKNMPIPYYRYSIFAAIWWAVLSGCKEIHLYGFELPHTIVNSTLDAHPTLKLVNGENVFTLLYKLWIDLLDYGIEIKIDNSGALSKQMRLVS